MITNSTLSLCKTAILPEKIIQLHDSLTASGLKNTTEKVALLIIEEYNFVFEPEMVRKNIQILLSHAISHDSPYMNNSENRQNLFFFCEFLLVMMDAVYFLHAKEIYGKLTN